MSDATSRRFWCAGVVALAASLSLGDHGPASTGRASGRPVDAERISEADRAGQGTPGAWFRIGDLLHDVMRKAHQDRPDRTRDAVEPRPEHVGTKFQIGVPSLDRGGIGR